MLERLIVWSGRHLTNRQTTSIIALLIGVLASLAAFSLHKLIALIQNLLTNDFVADSFNWLYLVFPVVGIWLTMLFIRYVVRDNISHGITRVLYAISTKQSKLKAHNCWTSLVASALTIGFGGSVGAEAPIVLTGSAIGSNLGRLFHMSNRQLMVLVGCGAAAAVAAIYKAPIAGLVFTLEVLMIDMNMASIVPILIATITADVVSYILAGNATMFTFQLDNVWCGGACAGHYPPWRFLRFRQPVFHAWHDVVRKRLREAERPSLQKTSFGRSAAQRAHLLFPLALR